MIYLKTSPYFDPTNEVIKLTIDVNKEHYPSFPTEVYVSEFYLDSVLSKLSGLDSSVQRLLNLPEEEHLKSWIAFGVTVHHTTKKDYFGINGDTIHYRWR